ncbi:MAG: acyl--CoA ligase [Novosphingobium sp.]|nr:acyl--CoA ligase [Novosphingobium sp.]
MPAETIAALLAGNAASRGSNVAVIDPQHRLTWSKLDNASAARAAELVEAGVNKGHRVALMAENSADWLVWACAAMRIGTVLVPLSTMLRGPEIAAQLAIAAVRHMIAQPQIRGRDMRDELAALDRAALPSLRNIWWSDEKLPAASPEAVAVSNALAERLLPADEMAVIFTSGSSGTPKGVVHTHGAAIRANASGNKARCITAESRLYLPMPLFWTGGFATGLMSALNTGCTLMTEAEPEPGKTLQFLAREKVTLFRGWPDQAARMAAQPDFAATDLSSLQPGSLDAIMPGEAPPSGARAPLLGMTESFGPWCGWPLDQLLPEGKLGSMGKPFAGAQARIVDPDSGQLLGADQTGAIQIGGPNILKGICGREREEVFTPDLWYDTGDRGRIDADGFLWFAGRGDQMVKIAGATVYPAETAAALEQLPGVERAVVCDITLDGEARLGAAIVADGQTTLAGVAASARDMLSAFKVPRLWLMLESADDLPRLVSGKIDSGTLRAMIAGKGVTAP